MIYSPDLLSSDSEVAPAPLELDLIRKYAVPGPRYTSYPPANKFHEDIASLDIDGALEADNVEPSKPLSLYFHLPFCESRCWYCGCTTIITRRRDWAYRYLEDLGREIALLAKRINPERRVSQLHFGGGTPTFFPPDALKQLGVAIHRHFKFTGDAELSVEIDPRHVTQAHVAALRGMGMNRASLGVQDTNAEVQQAIHRVQPNRLNRLTVVRLRASGIRSINLDLIYGLPKQTPESVAHTVDDVLALNPDRLSVFSYAHVPWIKPAQRIFDRRGEMPDPEAKLALFAVIREKLMQAGYVDIGLDHFARPDDELAVAHRAGALHRNFQGYSTRSGASLYGFGISSISQTEEVYRQSPKSLVPYRAALDAGQIPVERGYRVSVEDKRRRRLIMAVMCERRLDFRRIGGELGCDIASDYANELATLKPLVDEGLVEINATGLQVLPRGEPLVRVVAMAFDQTLSRTVRAHALTV
jgi:oxygen-independent coproporphyrinogen-3 oxidase